MYTSKGIPFIKYSATGNDFVVIDNREKNLDTSDSNFWKKCCSRRYAIGADGVLFLELSEMPKIDFRMIYLNADGGEAEMCGNGGQALVHFAHHHLKLKKESRYCFETKNGVYTAELLSNKNVRLKMTEIRDIDLLDISSLYAGDKAVYLNTGVPHCVFNCYGLEEIELEELGRRINCNPLFPGGTNVNFVEKIEECSIKIRTYERGVNQETLSCGTGAVASAIASSLFWKWGERIFVSVRGGDLEVTLNEDLSLIYLVGNVHDVFQGRYFF